MNRVVNSNAHFQRQAVNYLRNAYGLSYNKALSMFGKVRVQIAQKYGELSDTKIGTLNKLTLDAISNNISYGNPISATINSKDMSFKIKVYNNLEMEDAFRIATRKRMAQFSKRYINTTTYKEIYKQYFIDHTITYEQFKEKVEAFKRSDSSYAGGSM